MTQVLIGKGMHEYVSQSWLWKSAWSSQFLVRSSQARALIGEDGAVADFAFFDFVDGLVGFVHGKALGGGFDSVARGDVEHFAQLVGAADRAATDGALAGYEGKSVGRDRRRRNADEPKRSVGAQGLNIGAPVLIGIDCGENEVD